MIEIFWHVVRAQLCIKVICCTVWWLIVNTICISIIEITHNIILAKHCSNIISRCCTNIITQNATSTLLYQHYTRSITLSSTTTQPLTHPSSFHILTSFLIQILYLIASITFNHSWYQDQHLYNTFHSTFIDTHDSDNITWCNTIMVYPCDYHYFSNTVCNWSASTIINWYTRNQLIIL